MTDDISTYYGGSVLAMIGKDSVIIASDRRMGNKYLTIGINRTQIEEINSHCYVAITGFLPDAQFILEKLKAHISLFELSENRRIHVEEVSSLISFILYSYRTSPKYLEVIVCGISREASKPFISYMDCIGATTNSSDFGAIGTASDNLSGMAEALFVAEMSDEQLFTNSMQVFLNSIDRDAFSGWGAECYMISKDKVKRREVKCRND